MSMLNQKAWAPAEDEIVRSQYGRTPIEQLVELLPGRTMSAIQQRAFKIDAQTYRKPHWTAREDGLLAELYGTMSYKKLAEFFPNRSPRALKRRVELLGIAKKGGRK